MPMSLDREVIAVQVREIITASWPGRFTPEELLEDVSMGDEGLGLDSVEVAEVLLACEERSGTPLTDELFARAPLTIERVAEHFAAA